MPEGCIRIPVESPSVDAVSICMSPIDDIYSFSSEYDFVWESNIDTSHSDFQTWEGGGTRHNRYLPMGPRTVSADQPSDMQSSQTVSTSFQYRSVSLSLSNILCNEQQQGGYYELATSVSTNKGTLYNLDYSSRFYRLCVTEILNDQSSRPLINTIIDGQVDNVLNDFPPDTIDSIKLNSVANQDVGDYMEDFSLITRHRSQSSDPNIYMGYFTNTLDQTYSGCESLIDSNRTRTHIINTCDDLVMGGFISEFVRSIAWPVLDSNSREYIMKGPSIFNNDYTTHYSTPNLYPIGASRFIPRNYVNGKYNPLPPLELDKEASAAAAQCLDWGYGKNDPRLSLMLCIMEYYATYFYLTKSMFHWMVEFDAKALLSWIKIPSIGARGYTTDFISDGDYCYEWDDEDDRYFPSLYYKRNMEDSFKGPFLVYGCVRNAMFAAIERYTDSNVLGPLSSTDISLIGAIRMCRSECWNVDRIMAPKNNWNGRRITLYTEDYSCELPEFTAVSEGTHGCYMYPYVRFPHNPSGAISNVYMINASSPAAEPVLHQVTAGACISGGCDGIEVDNNFDHFLPEEKFIKANLGTNTKYTIGDDNIFIQRDTPDAPKPYITVTFSSDGLSYPPKDGPTSFDLPVCAELIACADYVGSPDKLAVRLFLKIVNSSLTSGYVTVGSTYQSTCSYIGDGKEMLHYENSSFVYAEIDVSCGQQLGVLDVVVNLDTQCLPYGKKCNLVVPNNNYNPGQSTIVKPIPADTQGCAFYDLTCIFKDPFRYLWELLGTLVTLLVIIVLVIALSCCLCNCRVPHVDHEE